VIELNIICPRHSPIRWISSIDAIRREDTPEIKRSNSSVCIPPVTVVHIDQIVISAVPGNTSKFSLVRPCSTIVTEFVITVPCTVFTGVCGNTPIWYHPRSLRSCIEGHGRISLRTWNFSTSKWHTLIVRVKNSCCRQILIAERTIQCIIFGIKGDWLAVACPVTIIYAWICIQRGYRTRSTGNGKSHDVLIESLSTFGLKLNECIVRTSEIWQMKVLCNGIKLRLRYHYPGHTPAGSVISGAHCPQCIITIAVMTPSYDDQWAVWCAAYVSPATVISTSIETIASLGHRQYWIKIRAGQCIDARNSRLMEHNSKTDFVILCRNGAKIREYIFCRSKCFKIASLL